MTLEEIIEKLHTIRRDTPLEIDMSNGNRMQIEYTPTDEFIVNYFDHQKILKSQVFPDEAGFVIFLRDQYEQKLI
jgi:hypothetical protein